MASYTYVARDESGLRREGMVQAETPNEALEHLHQRGLTPTSIDQTQTKVNSRGLRQAGRGRITSAELAALSWQLSAMLEGGITITTALEIAAEDTTNAQLKLVLQRAFANVTEGRPLSAAFRAFPQIFTKLAIAIMVAGEASGNLGHAMHILAEHFENRDKLARKMRAALAYPIFVVVLISAILLAIMVFVVPRFQRIFEQLGGELPAFTRGFMRFHDLVSHQAWLLILGIGSVGGGLVLLAKTKRGHEMLSRIVLRIPLFGKLVAEGFVATFCATTATLLEAGVPVLDAFEILEGMTTNDAIATAIAKARQRLTDGANIALSLATAGFFPNMVVKMTQVGEESGSLAPILRKTSEHYERRIGSTIDTAVGLLEPTLIVTIGIVVLVAVIALYLPIFTISDIAH